MQANSLALHEFGKDLERHVGSVNMAAILVASAVGSGLAATHFGLGPSAVPLGASGGRCHVVRRRDAAWLVPTFLLALGKASGTWQPQLHDAGRRPDAWHSRGAQAKMIAQEAAAHAHPTGHCS